MPKACSGASLSLLAKQEILADAIAQLLNLRGVLF